MRFIRYYIRDYASADAEIDHVIGAYGPRLYSWTGINQVHNITTILREKPDSRRAVIQIFDRTDTMKQSDIPCTCTLQFLLRDSKLHMIVNMRSSDVYVGFPHDVFAFTMLQEILASALGAELGAYKHMAGSMHLYDRDADAATLFMNEGWQPTTAMMPSMPTGDPTSSIDQILAAEKLLRHGSPLDSTAGEYLDPYWQNILHILQVYRGFKDRDAIYLDEARGQLTMPVYLPYADEKYQQLLKVLDEQRQEHC